MRCPYDQQLYADEAEGELKTLEGCGLSIPPLLPLLFISIRSNSLGIAVKICYTHDDDGCADHAGKYKRF